jgi:pimeloyl-ACP methyl ester carboxylesterase
VLGVAFSGLAPPRSRRFRAQGGSNIHVLDWRGQGPPVVLLHSGSLSARTWDYVAIALRADFRLVALDMRGHGASDWASDYSIESCATDLLDRRVHSNYRRARSRRPLTRCFDGKSIAALISSLRRVFVSRYVEPFQLAVCRLL